MTSITADSERLLKLIFGADWQRAWVCWKANMAGATVLALTMQNRTQPHEDVYFSVGKMRKGASARSNDNVESVNALVIDDVGTKVDKAGMEMLAPTPDWKLETSQGNFQWGYRIGGGGCSRADYEGLRAAMKGHPVWGKSEGVDAVHLFRLPQGRNTKPGKGWDISGQIEFCRLRGTPGPDRMVNDLLTAFGAPGGALSPGALQGSEPDEINGLGLLGEIVGLVPNDGSDREDWVNMAHAVWGASGGSSKEIFDAWSATWTQGTDDPAANDTLWNSISSSTIGRQWLIRKAGAADPKGLEAWLRKEAAAVFDDGAEMFAPVPPVVVPAVGVDAVQGMVAASIARDWKGSMQFNHDNGCWHVFSRGVWQQRPGKHKEGFLKAEAWAQAHARGLGKAQYKEVMKAGFYDGVENILRQKLSIRQADFDRNKWLLGTPGGTVDLKTGVLRPAEPSDYISKTTSVAPDAGAGCPRWERFIHEICKGDAEAKRFLQQWLGYCLTGDTSEQVFLFLYGPGGNGKSVLMDTAAAIMADYYRKPVADLYFAKQTARHMQEVAMLAGARLITVSEVPPNAAWDEGKLKDHTGGGAVTANFMRENSFSFVPQFKLTALGNHAPTFPGGMNAAIKRRFRLMLLDYIPARVDPDLMLRFEVEASGILAWMIEGLCHPAWGWHQTRLSFPTVVSDATAAFIHDQDIFGLWLETRTEKVATANTGATDLFNDWLDFRNTNGGGSLYGNPTTFSPELVGRGFRKLKLKANNAFEGIKLRSKAASEF